MSLSFAYSMTRAKVRKRSKRNRKHFTTVQNNKRHSTSVLEQGLRLCDDRESWESVTVVALQKCTRRTRRETVESAVRLVMGLRGMKSSETRDSGEVTEKMVWRKIAERCDCARNGVDRRIERRSD